MAELARHIAPMPWLYAGAIENRPRLVQALASARRLLGTESEALRRVRSPEFLRRVFQEAEIPAPAVVHKHGGLPSTGEWLLKPVRSAGGRGIRRWSGCSTPPKDLSDCYLQEFIPGPSCSALFLAEGRGSQLIGVTNQWIGRKWLHASEFAYCGSVGPLPLENKLQHAFQRIGNILADRCGLRGLFGVDAVICDGIPMPVEVNPRYTASCEVLEYALGIPILSRHAACFEKHSPAGSRSHGYPCVGKVILFARCDSTFPADGPWMDELEREFDPWRLPHYADIPGNHEKLMRGQPVMSLLAGGAGEAEVVADLRRRARDLDHRLTES